jgi:Ras-related protein Rab-1A
LKWLESLVEASKREDDYHTALETRIALIGPPKVGKTSLIRRWVSSLFTEAHKKTSKITHTSKELALSDGITITLSVRDVGGDTCLGLVNGDVDESVTSGLEGMIFVFDLTDSDSWGSIKRMVYSLIQDSEQMAVFLVGTKRDLKDKKQVNSSVAEAFAEQLGAAYFETSSKQSFQIDESFSVIVDLLYRTGRFHRSGMASGMCSVEGDVQDNEEEEEDEEEEEQEEEGPEEQGRGSKDHQKQGGESEGGEKHDEKR